MTYYLTNTFSPMMMGRGVAVDIVELGDVDEIPGVVLDNFVSAVSHEVTAEIIAALLDRPVEYNRINLVLVPGDEVFCIIPRFRADVAREFTREEVLKAGYRVFSISVL